MKSNFVSEKSKLSSVNDAMINAGLDFEVEKRPIFSINGDMQATKLNGLCYLYNATDGTPIGEKQNVVVTDRYVPIQCHEWFGVMQAILDANDGQIVKAGHWDDGKFSIMQCDFGSMDTPDGYEVRKQLTFRVPHDGKSSARADMLAWRLVCKNGLMGWSEDRIVRIRHTTNYKQAIQEAGRVLYHFNRYYEWFQSKAFELGTVRITKESAESILKSLVPDNPEAKSHTRTENIRKDMISRAWYGPGNSGKTGWDLYNGVIEYVDHKKDTLAAWTSGLYGNGANMKQNAMDTILEAATV